MIPLIDAGAGRHVPRPSQEVVLIPMIDREVVVLIQADRRSDAERHLRHTLTSAAGDRGRGGPAEPRSLFARLRDAILGWWSPGLPVADPLRQPTVVPERRLTPSGVGSRR
jgi:hypothetical protein